MIDVARLGRDGLGPVRLPGRPAALAALARRRRSASWSSASARPTSRQGLRDALADALGDPSLSLAYWVPEQGRYVDAAGQPVELPARGGDTACTPVEHEGEPVAVICHDAALTPSRELIRDRRRRRRLALENERLNAELRARVEELRASRARIVEAADEERRRLERDLHDGAQQRLVALALNLRLAGSKLDADPAAAKELLDEAADGARRRDRRAARARPRHPPGRADRPRPAPGARGARGPRAAAGRARRLRRPERLPAPVESAAYFVVAEALTNVARYAEATRAEVSVSRVNGRVEVEVRDDGVGGADPAAGSGLRGLADRVAALDGRLEVTSPRGAGTVVRAVIPCA